MTVRRLCSSRPATVWPCATGSHHGGTGLIADWLLTAVIQVVTTYTRHGDRVLLLAPPGHLDTLADRPETAGRGWRGSGAFAGLGEAAWAVARLGHGIQTQIDADTAAGRPVSEPRAAVDGSEPGPGLAESDRREAAKAGSSEHAGPEAGTGRDNPDRYHLIITTVDPRAIRPVPALEWADLLDPQGVLAIITHSDSGMGRLIDPTGAVVRAAHHAALTYLDHVALLQVPLRHGALDTPGSATSATPPPAGRSWRPARAVRVHSDLLIFSPIPAAGTHVDREETSDA